MQVELRILRYDPERDKKPHWERYRVESDPMDRVLDLLHKVKYEQDGTLTFRRSCAHGVCGSDAMLINGRNRLACKIRVDQLGKQGSRSRRCPACRVIKDLVVDMEAFFDKFRSVQPYLRSTTCRRPERERIQSAGRARALRRHDEVHPVRRLHVVLPVVLGPARRTSGRRRSSTPTGSSSTRATTRPTSGSRSSPTRTASGAAGRSSTAPTPARAGSTSPRRSSRSARAIVERRRLTEPRLPVIPHLVIRTDGAARGNPGPASLGRGAHRRLARRRARARRAARTRRSPRPWASRPTTSPSRRASLRALELAAGSGAEKVDLFLDSKLIVEQLHGRWRVKDAKLIPLHAEAKAMLGGFRRWSATHVPRAQNSTADRLANEALDRVAAGGPMRIARARRVAPEE